MTNKQKLDEVFGIETYISGCSKIKCDFDTKCNECQYQKFWEQEYQNDDYKEGYHQALEDFMDQICGLRQYDNDLTLVDLHTALSRLERKNNGNN